MSSFFKNVIQLLNWDNFSYNSPQKIYLSVHNISKHPALF